MTTPTPEQGVAVNTDREVWSAGLDYRDERVFITEGNGIGISVGGYCIVKPAAEWHRIAALAAARPSEAPALNFATPPEPQHAQARDPNNKETK
jgi:hypothetical protein